MKRAMALILALVLAFSMAACNDPAAREAFQLYLDMEASIADVGSVEMSVTGSMQLSSSAQDISFDMAGATRTIYKSETDCDMVMDLTLSMLGMEIATTTYYTGGWMYQEMMGMRYKIQADMEEMLQQGYANLEITEDLIEEASVSKQGGDTLLTFSLNDDAVNKLMGSTLDMVSLLGQTNLQGDDIKVGGITCKYIIGGDGLPKRANVDFTMEVGSGDEAATFSYDMQMTYDSFNTVEAIDFPADLDQFEELSMSSLLG